MITKLPFQFVNPDKFYFNCLKWRKTLQKPPFLMAAISLSVANIRAPTTLGPKYNRKYRMKYGKIQENVGNFKEDFLLAKQANDNKNACFLFILTHGTIHTDFRLHWNFELMTIDVVEHNLSRLAVWYQFFIPVQSLSNK